MTSANDSHPSLSELIAFDQGLLAPAEWTAVEAHLARCAECCARLEAVPDDALTSLLRSSSLADTSPPDADDATSFFVASSADAVAPVPPELTSHPRYRLLGVIGSGGMGTVYKAEHLLMGRTVALKVIHRNLIDNAAAVERFPREVRAAARLSHPNIVTAYDAEQASGLHFLVMEYVEGKTLDRVLTERGPVPVALACDWARQTALGLQHAHERGMVHRDIKPHNLLLSPLSGGVKILDFGLARLTSTTVPGEGLTPFGVVAGTPDYMAPEQALTPQQADIRADIYSLGCTLYHLLAGRPPFAGGTPLQKLMAHQEQEAVPLRSHRDDIPDGLETVVRRMLAKDPTRRYQTPAEVAAALIPFSRGDTEAQTAEIVRRTARGPTRRAVLAGGLLTAAILVAGLTWALTRDRGRPETDEDSGDPVRVIGGEEWGPFNRAAISDDGRFALSANEDFSVGLWDLEAGKEVSRLPAHKSSVMGLAFSHDGKHALTSGRDRAVCLWDLEQHKLLWRKQEHNSWVRGVVFTSDNARALSCGNDGVVLYWNVPDGRVLHRFLGHLTAVSCVAFSPSGRYAASGSYDHMILLWDLLERRPLRQLEGHTNPVVAVAFSPDGEHLLSAGGDMTMRLWEVATGKEVRRFKVPKGGLTGVAFSLDSRLALSSATDGTARLWDVASGKELYCFRGPPGIVHRATFMPDGRHIVTGDKDGTFRIWRLPATSRDSPRSN